MSVVAELEFTQEGIESVVGKPAELGAMLSSEYAIMPVDGWLGAHHHLSTCLGVMLLSFYQGLSLCSLISIGCDDSE